MFLGKFKLLVLFALITEFLLSPNVFASEQCVKQGYTIATINGVFTNESGAAKNANALFDRIGETYNGESIAVKYLLNPSHLGGLGDIAVSVYQKIFDSGKVEDYDLVEMLKIASEQVRTQKLLIIAHSQGNFYANSFYDVVAGQVGGIPKESIGVYGVATPAGRVVGGGKWLTSDTDTVIAGIVARAPFKNIMPPNTHIELQSGDDALGHSFSDVYLKYSGARIISDIQASLDKLSENNIQNEKELCIDPPELTLAHKAMGAILVVADPIASVGGNAVVGAALAVHNTNKFIANLGDRVNSVAVGTAGGLFANISAVFENDNSGDLKLVAEIPLGKKESGVVDSSGQVAANKDKRMNRTNETNNSDRTNQSVVLTDFQDEDAAEEAAKQKHQTTTNNNQQQITTNLNLVASAQSVSAGIGQAGQGEATAKQCTYNVTQSLSRTKLILNEIAWMGGSVSANDEWLELKNISGGELDISGWQILDKDAQVKITFANGTKMVAGGLLLLERTNDDSIPGVVADLIYAGALSNTDEGLRLFDNNCVLVDEVTASPDWLAGESEARKTMERSADLSWHTYSGSGENFGGALIMGTPKKDNSAPVTTNNQQQTNNNEATTHLLISEVQITGGTGKTNNDFIEFYNPNTQPINLNGYRLVKRTKTGTSDTSIKSWTSDTFIPAKSYYLWANSDYLEIPTAPDVTTSATLANDNGVAIRFGSENTGTIVDSVGWGGAENIFVETQAFPENPIANQSISRQSENDSNNNAVDFIKSKPTPKNSSVSGGFLNLDAWVVLEQLVNHLVISEIYPDQTGANKDFVELYNPNAASTGDLDISNWSLQVLSASATTTDKIIKKNFVAGNKVSGRGFFLIGMDSYSGGDMAWASGSLNSTVGATIFLVSGTTTISDITDSRIVDRVSYGNGSAADFAEAVAASMPAAGQSLERKAFQNDFCVSSQNNGEFLGNGCDTGDNSVDFELRAVPNPQTMQKLPEPRIAPSLPRNFSAVYASSSAQMFLSWDVFNDYKGATSTLSYSISYATSSAALKNLTTVSATTTYLFKINDVGTNYSFSISAKDNEGLSSATATASLSVSSPLTNLYFYKDYRSTSSKKYLFDLYYDSYPFIPNSYNSKTGRIMVFYLNKEAPNEIELNSANHFYPQNPNGTVKDGVVEIIYTKCSGDSPSSAGSPRFSLILPGPCGTAGGAENSTLTSGSLEDSHLLFALVKATDDIIFTDRDFVTVGMYSYYDYNSGWETYHLAVLDRNKYFFQNQPPSHNSPELGGAVVVNFNKSTSKLETEWQKATDLDTLNIFLTYEISYDGGVSWQSTGAQNKTQKIVAPGQTFSILVRAKDDFGNYSDPPLTADWSYPETIFYIEQNQTNSWSMNFGTKNDNCPWCPGTASLQSIRLEEDFEFNNVTLKLRQEFGADSADIQLSVYPDLNNRPDFDSLIAEAQLKNIIWPDPNLDIAFTFDEPVSFEAGNQYWLVLGVEQYSDSRGYFRNRWQNAINTGEDLYEDGQAGSGNAGICNGGYCSNVYIPYPDATADWHMKIGLSEY